MRFRRELRAAGVIMSLTCSCSTSQQRPVNVPSDAVKVIGAKGTGPWQSCELTRADQVHCRLFNINGEILYDDTFIVYSGRRPKSPSDLRISTKGGEQWVLLENGTVLIPEKHRTEITRFLDWLFGKRRTR
jgi:hypothetical protein